MEFCSGTWDTAVKGRECDILVCPTGFRRGEVADLQRGQQLEVAHMHHMLVGDLLCMRAPCASNLQTASSEKQEPLTRRIPLCVRLDIQPSPHLPYPCEV